MNQELAKFANALREVLGLDPLYIDGRGRQDVPDAQRFYIAPFRVPTARAASLAPVSHCRGRK